MEDAEHAHKELFPKTINASNVASSKLDKITHALNAQIILLKLIMLARNVLMGNLLPIINVLTSNVEADK